jgi:hypothetical protein
VKAKHLRPLAQRLFRPAWGCCPCLKQSEYGKVILPFTVLRRLDCVLEATKAAVLTEKATREAAGLNPEPFLLRKAGPFFYNTSPLDLKKRMGDQDHIGENLRAYLQAFSPEVRDIFESFEFHTQLVPAAPDLQNALGCGRRQPLWQQGQSATDRRQQLLAKDAQKPRVKAQGTQRRTHRRHHPPAWQF